MACPLSGILPHALLPKCDVTGRKQEQWLLIELIAFSLKACDSFICSSKGKACGVGGMCGARCGKDASQDTSTSSPTFLTSAPPHPLTPAVLPPLQGWGPSAQGRWGRAPDRTSHTRGSSWALNFFFLFFPDLLLSLEENLPIPFLTTLLFSPQRQLVLMR